MNDVAPTARDIAAVQEKLADLYASMPPAQQAVLDMIMAAGLSMVMDDDTGGYGMPASWEEVGIVNRQRAAELREAWRSANTSRTGADAAKSELRWDLQPLMDWFSRPQRPAPQT